METPDERSAPARRERARDAIGLVVCGSVWLALSVALVLYVRNNSRNVPFCDEFGMISVMTGAEPVSLRWAWAQHNEHRPVVPRLIMVGLFRLIGNDFRVIRYANAVLLSMMAASMLVLARRVRGSARATDAVLPLSILNIAQVESLMIGFAMNLILTSMLAIALLAMSIRARGTTRAIGFGLSMVLLPLCGGSGLAMLPPLALWLAGYLAMGWWSGRSPALATRAVGAALLLASVSVSLLYLRGYERPSYHPPPPSMEAIASSTLMYLSLAVYPEVSSYWRPAGPILAALVIATMALLGIAIRRQPDERPRALGLLAVILSMLAVAVAVGYSRSALGPGAILASRYITLTVPLLCAIYLSWLLYGRGPARAGVHLGLFALMLVASPDCLRFSRDYGSHVRAVELRVERALQNHAPTAVLMSRACPALFNHPGLAYDSFRRLKAARVGAFAQFESDPIAVCPVSDGPVRR